MRPSRAAALFFCGLMACFAAQAKMYKWKDAAGVEHYSNTPPSSPAVKTLVVEGNISSYDPPEASSGKLDALQGAPAGSSGVELFSTSWCGYCKLAKQYLSSHGIPFQEYDVEKDPSAAARARRLGWTGGVPFAMINGKPVSGFSQRLYDSLFSSKK